ncbi:MAG: hypothetical protein AAF990_25605 [Bacteroidota bacterium]
MTNLMMRRLICCLLVLCCLTALQAQDEKTGLSKEALKEKALKDIVALQNGVLIVRLPSKHKKIKELTRLSQSEGLSKKKRKRFEKTLKTALAEKEREERDIVNVYKKNYFFSDLLFTYDTSTVHLKEGHYSGIFLNDSLEIDPTISVGDRACFFIRMGSLQKNKNAPGRRVAFMLDQNFETLQDPFPYYVKTVSFSDAALSPFKPEALSMAGFRAGHIAKRFDSWLSYFYKMNIEKKEEEAEEDQ